MRRLSPYLILGLLILAPFVAATLSAVQAGPLLQEGDQPVTPETNFGQFVLDIRQDLELLADEVNGPDIRPSGWNGNADAASASILADVWLDLELQADELAGIEGARPKGWLGASSTTPERIARNLRHDLEMLADMAFNVGARPDDWVGAPALFTCNVTVQNLVSVLRRTFEWQPVTPDSVVNYCGAVAGEAQDKVAVEGVAMLDGDVPQLLENVRGDLERLADELNGLDVRPEGYLRTIVFDSTQMSNDLLTDLELLADQHFGADNRPPQWIGAIGLSPGVAVRNLRHDLELMADLTLADRDLENGRPFGWLGTEGIRDDYTFCESATTSLVLLLDKYYRFSPPAEEAPDIDTYCANLDRAANVYAESDPERASDEELAGVLGRSGKPVAVSDWAFAYLDVAALQYMGIMPRGTEFEAWYRNFADSKMMYVVGEEFALYVSQEWTTLEEDAFYRLPTLEGVIPETYCFAQWCAGPGPTPTPTGMAPTPTPGAAPGGPPPGGEGLVLVPWNQINVYYDLDRPEAGTVQVRMELCAGVGFACEPVQNVYDSNGNPLPLINVVGPYPVFEMPYGYSNSYTLLSTSYYANEVWISDPTLRGVTYQ